MNKKPTSKNLRISSIDLKSYLRKTGLSQNKLAKLLNVNAATITRWVDDQKYPQFPTSTALLILVPLLLSEDIDILPKPDDEEILNLERKLRTLGLLSLGDLKKGKAKKAIRRLAALESSKEVAASRNLFQALRIAWEKIDSPIGPLG